MEGLRVAFGNKWALVIPIYLAIAFPLVMILSYQQIDDISRIAFYYLFSAQAQVLGTILALVFTTTVVAAQLASRYSQHVSHRVFGSWAVYYSLIYLAGIGLPLFLMSGHFPLKAAHLSVILGGLCLVLLMPYSAVLRRRLSIDSLILELEAGASKDPKGCLLELMDVGMGALSLYDHRTFERVQVALRKIGKSLISEESISRGSNGLEILGNILLDGLKDMALDALSHSMAPFRTIDTLRELGREAARKELLDETKKVIGILSKVALEAIRHDLHDRAEYAIGAIGLVSLEATQSAFWKAARYGMRGLKEQGQAAVLRNMDNAARQAGDGLSAVAQTAIRCRGSASTGAPDRLAQDCVEALGELGRVSVEAGMDDLARHIMSKLPKIVELAIPLDMRHIVFRSLTAIDSVRASADTRLPGILLGAIVGALSEVLKMLMEVKAMTDWRKQAIKRAIPIFKEMGLKAIEEEFWEQVAKVVLTFGIQGKNALDQQEFRDIGEECFNALEELANTLLKKAGAIPTEGWEREGVMWRLATALGYTGTAAAAHGIRELSESSLELLGKILRAAEQRGYHATVIAALDGLSHITEALLGIESPEEELKEEDLEGGCGTR